VTNELSYRFLRLANEWYEDTLCMSSVQQMVAHPAHLSIIAMGDLAIPFILDELEKEAHHWFVALAALTGENPILEEHRGNVPEMRRAWLEWGRENSYL